MKITRQEAELLGKAVETRMNVVRQWLEHPVIRGAVDTAALCDEQESYVRLRRKIDASRKAMLNKELGL